MTDSVDPDQTAPCLLLYLKSSVMLDNYLQQTTSADVIFQMLFFFLGALRIKSYLFWIFDPKAKISPFSIEILLVTLFLIVVIVQSQLQRTTFKNNT